jgi:hypothetical protein
MTIVLVRGTHLSISSGESSDRPFYFRLLVPLALLVRTSSVNFCEKAILFGGTFMFPQPYSVEPLCLPLVGFSVRCEATTSLALARTTSHSAADFPLSSLTTWPRLTCRPLSEVRDGLMLFRYLKAEYILGADAIIHVASPLPNAGTPEVILDVRNRQTSIFYQLVDQVLF